MFMSLCVFSLLSWTEESLTEATGESADQYASGDGNEKPDPEEEPPSGG